MKFKLPKTEGLAEYYDFDKAVFVLRCENGHYLGETKKKVALGSALQTETMKMSRTFKKKPKDGDNVVCPECNTPHVHLGIIRLTDTPKQRKMKIYEIEFQPMWPVPSALLICAKDKKTALKIAKETIQHKQTAPITIKRIIELDQPKVLVYESGNY